MREQDYITEARQHAKKIWDAMTALKSMQTEWNAQGWGPQGAVTLPDGVGENEGVTAEEVRAVVFDTADVMDTQMSTGVHGQNLVKLL